MKRECVILTDPKRKEHGIGHLGKHQGWSGGRGREGNCGQTFSFCGFHKKKQARQGEQTSDWLV